MWMKLVRFGGEEHRKGQGKNKGEYGTGHQKEHVVSQGTPHIFVRQKPGEIAEAYKFDVLGVAAPLTDTENQRFDTGINTKDDIQKKGRDHIGQDKSFVPFAQHASSSFCCEAINAMTCSRSGLSPRRT